MRTTEGLSGQEVFRMLTRIYVRFQHALAGDDGVTAVEYGIMAALIAVVIAVTVSLLGEHLSAIFGSIAGKVAVVPS